jgi:hypothetical protein
VALGGFRRLVNEDDRFKIPTAAAVTTAPVRDEASQEAKRAARKERRKR